MTNKAKIDVRAPYTFESVRQSIIAKRNALDKSGQKTPLRKIAKDYGGVSHGVIQRILAGKEPHDTKIRRALGLSEEIIIHAAPLKCGHISLSKRCKICHPDPKYKPHPVMRLTKLRRLMQSPYNA